MSSVLRAASRRLGAACVLRCSGRAGGTIYMSFVSGDVLIYIESMYAMDACHLASETNKVGGQSGLVSTGMSLALR